AVYAAVDAGRRGTLGEHYFEGVNPGHAAYAGIAAAHARILPLYQINEPALRHALMMFAALNPTFNPDAADVHAINASVAGLDPFNAEKLGAAVYAAVDAGRRGTLGEHYFEG